MNIRFKTQFTGQEGQVGTQKEAVLRTQAYQAQYSQRQAAFFFSAAAITLLLEQSEAAGIRFYYGESTPGQQALIAVATSKTGKDLSAGAIIRDTTTAAGRQPLATLTSSPAVNRAVVESITLTQAADWTAQHRATLPGTMHGAFFGRELLLATLQRDNAAGLGLYSCLTERGELSLLFIPLADEQSQVTCGFWEWLVTTMNPMICPNQCDPNGLFGFSLAHLSLGAAQNLRVQRAQQRAACLLAK